jgi:hypothetical protein
MSDLDRQFSCVSHAENERLKSGKEIFSSFPAMAGFFAAVAVELFDEPGFRIDWDAAQGKMANIETALSTLAGKMAEMPEEALAEFLQLQLLEERLSQRSGQVGRFERELFRSAFASMIRNADRLHSLEP